MEFNKIRVNEHTSDNLAIAFDPSHISKSGKKNAGRRLFLVWSAGRAKWGMENGGLAAVDVDNRTAFHLEAVQTIDLTEGETLPKYNAKVVLERVMEGFPKSNFHIIFPVFYLYKESSDPRFFET